MSQEQTQSVEERAIHTIRTLSIDAVDKANSGHPGMPMGAAPMGYALYAKHMRHNPSNPKWFNRDRFVLSAGHGSMLQYSLLHLTGYDVTLDDLKEFRQMGSKTPGHPEYGHTPGVDATTGPLGQGVAMAVGMAMAEAHLGAMLNRDGYPVVDHFTYAICGDGDLMEGVSAEAASMAGHMRLGKLVVLYDSNDISLDGQTAFAFTENVAARFEAYGWQVLRVEDGNDVNAISQAIETAQSDTQRPTLIEVKTVIGYGSPNRAGKKEAHGMPLGADETALAKAAYGWSHEPFFVPEDVRAHFADVKGRGETHESVWEQMVSDYKSAHPEMEPLLDHVVNGTLPDGWDKALPQYGIEQAKMATRQASGNAINALAPHLPTLFGGSADLQSSNNTAMKEAAVFHAEDFSGRNIWFGVREFAMGAAMNGIALHGGLQVYGGTFFVFSDYLRPAIRLAALMQTHVIYVLTHDSIAVGEDGPTHEPVEHLPSLRVIPGLTVLRPADANETVEAWRYAVGGQSGPVALVLTRQGLPILDGTVKWSRSHLQKGAYVVSPAGGVDAAAEPVADTADALILATGSEVSLAVAAQKELASQGVRVNVVSMPSWELFEKQPQEYRDQVLPPSITKRLAVEMAYPLGWERYVGSEGRIMGIDRFGASGPEKQVLAAYGFTVDNVVKNVLEMLGK